MKFFKREAFFLLSIMTVCSLEAQTVKVDDNELYAPREVKCKKSVGISEYLVTYRYLFPMDTISGNTYEDIMVLQIGNEISHYYSRNSDFCDSIVYKGILGNAESLQYPRYWLKPNQKAIPDDIYWNYPSKGVLLNQFRIFTTEYLCQEPLPIQNWTILHNSFYEILGYHCICAKTTFRGREYIAYFAPDIPLSYGPWKFHGLPGLILKIEEASQKFIWEAIGIEKRRSFIFVYDSHKMKSISSMFPMHTKEIHREQSLKLRTKLWSDPLGIMQQHGQKFSQPLTEERREASRNPYVPPLELE